MCLRISAKFYLYIIWKNWFQTSERERGEGKFYSFKFVFIFALRKW